MSTAEWGKAQCSSERPMTLMHSSSHNSHSSSLSPAEAGQLEARMQRQPCAAVSGGDGSSSSRSSSSPGGATRDWMLHATPGAGLVSSMHACTAECRRSSSQPPGSLMGESLPRPPTSSLRPSRHPAVTPVRSSSGGTETQHPSPSTHPHTRTPLSSASEPATAACAAAASLRTQPRLELQGNAPGSPDSPDTRSKEAAGAASDPVHMLVAVCVAH
ncbi:MAG: hypothetical protein WDW38_003671 [Sanguina aurantia]